MNILKDSDAPLLLDGAMGTELQAKGLLPGEAPGASLPQASGRASALRAALQDRLRQPPSVVSNPLKAGHIPQALPPVRSLLPEFLPNPEARGAQAGALQAPRKAV